jgi:threonine dehydrogenase-like Zn-dependent dehydrogenase
MKAMAVFPATREVKLIEHPEPQITGPTEVRLRMLEVGICGTDRDIATFQYGTPPAGEDYLIIGHESLGEVVGVGAEVKGFRPGDLVVLMVRRPCSVPTCLACRAGRPDFCFTGRYQERGIKGLHGYMTEFVVDDQKYMNLVPRQLRGVAVLVEPLTIGEKGLAQVMLVQQRLPWGCPAPMAGESGYRHQALVLGAGPVGLLGAMTVCAAGFETTVYSRTLDPRTIGNLVEAIGGQFVSAPETSIDALAKRMGNIDLVFEATGASSLAFETMPFLGANAVFVFTGVPGRRGPITLEADRIMRDLVLKNQIVFGTVNADRSAFEAAIRDLGVFTGRWPGTVQALITGRHPIEGAPEFLVKLTPGIKQVITIG